MELIHEGSVRVLLGSSRQLSISIEQVEGFHCFVLWPELLVRVKVEIEMSEPSRGLVVEPFLHVVETEGVLWHERS